MARFQPAYGTARHNSQSLILRSSHRVKNRGFRQSSGILGAITKNSLKTSKNYPESYGLVVLLFVRISTVICDRPDGLLSQLPLS
ncbi:hypothetical protein [[Limnothrix rosea] IAM M-220]|uniref:hypothetical protein n=1 Tax=[Limnothrix rosea] IAM M-220 TaxID=454133 RepID=UPI00111574DB|nr:hypothetical protein [[Limnothrix rosea] IAM M-220]